MTITIGDIVTRVKLYARNQNLNDAQAIDSINTAVTNVLEQVDVPGYQSEYVFQFFQDQPVYSAPADFGEPLWLRYQNNDLNENKRFSYQIGELLFERINSVDNGTYVFGRYDGTGSPQLIVLAQNSVPLLVVDTFDYDNASNWTGSDDATGITDDTNTFKEGSGSLLYNVDTSLTGNNRATITRSVISEDLTTFNSIGHAKIWHYIPNVTNFTSVTLNWGTDNSNYWKTSVTTQEDGSSFMVGWNALDFSWANATSVGTPSASAVLKYWLQDNFTNSYVSTDGFRYDYLRWEVPDNMILTYQTLSVGKNSAGTAIQQFSADSDTLLFSDPRIMDAVAAYAAIIVNPQLLVDGTAPNKIFTDVLILLKRKYPKKRINNKLADPKRTKTPYDGYLGLRN